MTVLSHVSGTQRCFVGDMSSWVDRDEEWHGDEILASSHNGRVRLSYVDEVIAEKDSGKRRGLLHRVLGLF
jgi:hypothetical protein